MFKIPWNVQKIWRNLGIKEDNGIASQTLSFNSNFCSEKKDFTFAVDLNAFVTYGTH